MKQKLYSIGYLDSLWRQAIKVLYHGRCAYCKRPGNEAHHIIRRSRILLRWDIKNGIYLCQEHHSWVHTRAGDRWLAKYIPEMDYLEAYEYKTLKEYLHDNGMTNAEFREDKVKELKRLIHDEKSSF
jgi:hypothetical protein